jgi:hypothetical protein
VKRIALILSALALLAAALVFKLDQYRARAARVGRVSVNPARVYDVSPPLAALQLRGPAIESTECEQGCGVSPAAAEVEADVQTPETPRPHAVPAGSEAVEQKRQGSRPAALLLESFDGHGYGQVGPQGTGAGNNPSDNSLAVGPNHIVETVNSRIAIYTRKGAVFDRTGTVLFGPISTNVLFSGFGGECERAPNGDAVVRYDQLAERWLYVMPLFRRAPSAPGQPPGKYGMCYALSTGANPMGPYHRYYFERELFPDYPRPAIWPDGYYIPTSTGDNVIEKHACVLDRTRMLVGGPATEQCIIIQDVNFLNNADIDGPGLPPPGAPNIMMAAGGTQLRQDFEDDGIYAWNFHVDWENPSNTKVTGPLKIAVAPYNYLCNGQLTRCVPQPGTDVRLDAQGDKIMQRLVYRNIAGRESIVAVHSVNTSAGAGGVRWYEFRLDRQRNPVLYQQGTFAPDSFYRWMASPGMDRQGNIGIGFSYGGTPHFPGQRFAGRLADDTLGRLTFHETILVEGQASQSPAFRWEDYTQLSMDPVDDCTFWYVGDYLKAGAPSYTTRIGAFRLPGCLRGSVSGTSYFDVNHNGFREPNEPGLVNWQVDYASVRRPQDRLPPVAGRLTTDARGDFQIELPADPAYANPSYTFSVRTPTQRAWTRSSTGMAHTSRGPLAMIAGSYTITLRDRDVATHVSFGHICTVPNTGGSPPTHWSAESGQAILARNDQQPAELPARGARGGGRGRGRGGADAGWRTLLNNTRFLARANGSQFIVLPGPFEAAYAPLRAWLNEPAGTNAAHALSIQLAAATLNAAYGSQSGTATVMDPVTREWTTIAVLLNRVSGFIAEHPNTTGSSADRRTAEAYRTVLDALNRNSAQVTPPAPDGCPAAF